MNIGTIIKDLKYFDYKYNNYEVLNDLFVMSALSISNSIELNEKIKAKREEQYNIISSKYNSEDLKQFTKIFAEIIKLYESESISDFLGEIFMQSMTQNSGAKGQVFTPYSLSKACAECAVDEQMLKKDIITMYEPACGGGGMIIAFLDTLKNNHNIDYTTRVFVLAGDVDKRCCAMTYIALSLLGCPAIVEEKNALSGEFYDRWETPAYKMQYLKFKDVARSLVYETK